MRRSSWAAAELLSSPAVATRKTRVTVRATEGMARLIEAKADGRRHRTGSYNVYEPLDGTGPKAAGLAQGAHQMGTRAPRVLLYAEV